MKVRELRNKNYSKVKQYIVFSINGYHGYDMHPNVDSLSVEYDHAAIGLMT